MSYEFDQVSIKGFGGSFQNKVPMLVLRWKAIFNKKIAKKLGIYDDVFVKNGDSYSIRKFTEHGLPFYIDDAEIAVYQDMGREPLRFEGRVKKIAVVTDKEGTEITFQTQARLDSPGQMNFMMNQGNEPAPKMSITGKQRELFEDDDPLPEGPQQLEVAS